MSRFTEYFCTIFTYIKYSIRYIGEIAEKEIRGTLGSYFQLMITIGILFVYAVGAGVNLFWLSIICGIIPLIFGVVFFLMPGKNLV